MVAISGTSLMSGPGRLAGIVNAILTGQTYLNIHTVNLSGGRNPWKPSAGFWLANPADAAARPGL